ncbi:NAD(P)H-dependent glycerol-3-phosphate dehydrogenase [Candidatus Paracaedibacter symbiosus]|uniref:NAD(P)H-dependent glycerol-3-phosphate dehydrogenase n=1 Tax=Candidatus Paracaedibacter symbiosus TaxID=244582 RepID=UPI00050957F9|nr:NAD(P)H-dependent glycerol-3-phosphate dehydrogenase [Candidatus Paracaedibacter symbiosus]
MTLKKIAVYGSGAFGTALAISCVRAGQDVALLTRSPVTAAILNADRRNERYLPGITFPESLKISHDLKNLTSSDLILLATPAQSLFTVLADLKPYLNPMTPLILCAKGIDRQHQMLLSDVAKQQVSNPIAMLSGPSFAIEIAQNQPTAVMLAAESLEDAIALSQPLRHANFRCYASEDLVGVQIAGAVKNVIAIASGIVYGKAFGNNTRAALLSRGLAEMCRLGLAMGAKQETFLGLAGVGDLILTGTSELSRNFCFGKIWGETLSRETAMAAMAGKVVEGSATAEVLKSIAEQHQVRMPICQNVYDLLYTAKPLQEIIDALLSHQSNLEI